MKKASVFISILILFVAFVSFIAQQNNDPDKPFFIPPSQQRSGDPAQGYTYLTTGNFLSSGVPYGLFTMVNGKDKRNYLNRTGKNATVDQGYNVVTTADGIDIVIPTCLQCHAQVFNDSLYIGMGNTTIDFTNISKQDNIANNAGVKMVQTFSPKQYSAMKPLLDVFKIVYPKLETEVRGVNSADRLATVLVAHRDPQTLQWSNEPILQIPDATIPTDVPAWWLLKKKNAMFYNGFGRGDFGKFLMLSNILTVKDSSEAREVNTHFGDVLAYIRSIQAPKFPKKINQSLAAEGKTIFTTTCSKCHGTYGENESYPNLLIPASIIKTDSLLYAGNQQNPQFIDWFNNSWFAKGDNPAKLEPSKGYIAPPLDGVWITAPYLHNGSVPTLEGVLNSKTRPTYWSRNFTTYDYNYENPGLVHTVHDKPDGKKRYNTTLPGYSNQGHTFGDHFSNKERKALIEYLKTL